MPIRFNPLLPILLVSLAGPAVSRDFGTEEQARSAAARVVAIIDSSGLDAGVETLLNPDGPFADSRLGINLFQGSILIADNREPETLGADYGETVDLNGSAIWPIIEEALARSADAELRWFHYDTQEPYDYLCFSARPETARDVTVMVCR